MAWLGMPVGEELRWISSLSDARRRGQAAADGMSVDQLLHARRIARAAPWLKPGVMLGLTASSGSMEPVSLAAKLAAVRSAQQNPTNKRPGSRVRGAELTPGHRKLFDQDGNRAAQFNQAAQYVTGQMRRGAEAETIRGLKDEGILSDRGELQAPVPAAQLQEYVDDPGAYAQRRPQEAAKIQRFVDFVQDLAGEQRDIPRRGATGEWQEVSFLTQGGRAGRYHPVSRQFYEPEPGVEGENVLDPSGILEFARRRSTGGVGLAEAYEPITSPLAEGLETQLPQFRLPGAGPTPQELTQTAGIQSPADLTQAGFMALQALPQEAQGYIRNAYGQMQGRDVDWWQPQSDLLISLTTGMDPGEGLLSADPDSEVAKERRRREEERGLIGGHRVTAGRWFASSITQPGTQAYNTLSGLVDATVGFFADPTVITAGRLSNVAKARTMFAAGDEIAGASPWLKGLKPGFIRQQREEAGLVEGLLTNDIHGPTADGWLVGRKATKGVIEPLTEMTDPYEIYLYTGRQLDNHTVTALADARETNQVRDILRPHLGTTFRTTNDVWKDPMLLGNRTRKGLAMVPHSIDPMSPESWVRETENWARGAIETKARRGFTVEKAGEFMSRMIRAPSNNARWTVLTDMMNDADGVLAQAGLESPSLRKETTRLFRETVDDSGLWFVDELGNNKSFWHDVAAGDDIIPGVGPQLLVEHIGRSIPLPNLSEFKALTAKYPNLTKMAPDQWTAAGTAARWPKAFLDSMVNDVWKPFTLLRAAWPLRVIGEEQARMGMAGLHSLFSEHPISGLSWALGRSESGRITRRAEQALTKVPGVKRRGALTGLGTPFEEADEFQAAQLSSKRAGGFLDEKPGRVRTGQWKIYDRGQPDFERAWSEELALLAQDHIARKVAQSDSLDDVMRWLGSKEGRPLWDEMIDSHPILAEPNAARRYLETVAERIDIKTGGNTDLLDAIRTGKFRGEDWLAEGLRPTPQFRRALLDDYIDAAPDAVKGREIGYGPMANLGIVKRGWDHAVDWAFAGLFSTPDNYLTSSPVYRQFYWQRDEELMAHMTPLAKDTHLANARKANLPRGTIKRMEGIKAKGVLNEEEAHALAKGYALDEKKKLVYDLAQKSQVGQQLQIMFPFIEAWREVLTTWNRLLDPIFTTGDLAQRGRAVRNVRRAQQIVTGLRGSGLGEVLGVPEIWDPDKEHWRQPGFFWKDEFGEEVFMYPGSQWMTGTLTDLLPGVPRVEVPLSGRVQGLNMLGQVFPGVGPVAAIPTSYLLPDKPGVQRWLRERFLPFGSLVDEGGAQGWSAVLNPLNYAPNWMKTGIQALINGGFDQQTNRMWANAQMATANYLYSTGRYDTTSPGGKQKLLDDAKDGARALYFVQSLVAFGAPTAPSKQFMVEAQPGLIRLAMLRDDYYQLLGEDPATADEKFLERWGKFDAPPGKDQVGMTMQAFTREIQGGLGVSKEWGDWAGKSEAKYLKTRYPDIWAFFGPADEDAKFDYDTYLQQVLKGQREQLTLEEWYDLGQQHLGRMHLDAAEAEIAANPGDEDEDAQYLADLETWVYENYPGYRTGGEIPGTEKRASREDVMRQLTDAIQDKRVRKTKTGKALADYWNERLVSVDYASSLGTLKVNGPWYDLSRSVDLADDRAFLFDLGEWWAREDDGFKAIWNRHLRAEVEPSEEELAEEEEAA